MTPLFTIKDNTLSLYEFYNSGFLKKLEDEGKVTLDVVEEGDDGTMTVSGDPSMKDALLAQLKTDFYLDETEVTIL